MTDKRRAIEPGYSHDWTDAAGIPKRQPKTPEQLYGENLIAFRPRGNTYTPLVESEWVKELQTAIDGYTPIYTLQERAKIKAALSAIISATREETKRPAQSSRTTLTKGKLTN